MVAWTVWCFGASFSIAFPSCLAKILEASPCTIVAAGMQVHTIVPAGMQERPEEAAYSCCGTRHAGTPRRSGILLLSRCPEEATGDDCSDNWQNEALNCFCHLGWMHGMAAPDTVSVEVALAEAADVVGVIAVVRPCSSL